MAKRLSINMILSDLTNGITRSTNATRTTTTDLEDGQVIVVGTTESSYTIPLTTIGLLVGFNETKTADDPDRYVDIGWATTVYDYRVYSQEPLVIPMNKTGGPHTIFVKASAPNTPLRLHVTDARTGV